MNTRRRQLHKSPVFQYSSRTDLSRTQNSQRLNFQDEAALNKHFQASLNEQDHPRPCHLNPYSLRCGSLWLSRKSKEETSMTSFQRHYTRSVPEYLRQRHRGNENQARQLPILETLRQKILVAPDRHRQNQTGTGISHSLNTWPMTRS